MRQSNVKGHHPSKSQPKIPENDAENGHGSILVPASPIRPTGGKGLRIDKGRRHPKGKAHPYRSSDRSELRQAWRTDPALFAKLHNVFRFTIDACADRDNTLLPRYWTKEVDAALQDWRGERVFCNPPFQGAKRIIARAPEAELTVMVFMLNSLTTGYFHSAPAPYLLVPPKRLSFVPPPGIDKSSMAFGTCLLVWGTLTAKQRRQLEHDWLIYGTKL